MSRLLINGELFAFEHGSYACVLGSNAFVAMFGRTASIEILSESGTFLSAINLADGEACQVDFNERVFFLATESTSAKAHVEHNFMNESLAVMSLERFELQDALVGLIEDQSDFEGEYGFESCSIGVPLRLSEPCACQAMTKIAGNSVSLWRNAAATFSTMMRFLQRNSAAMKWQCFSDDGEYLPHEACYSDHGN
jgi:hypothetical protein